MTTAKKKRRKSPTAMALDELATLGFVAGKVEQTIPRTFIKRDFLGFVDVIYCTPTSIVALQVTSGGGSGKSNAKARRRKILAEPRALAWVKAGGLIEIWNYVKREDAWGCEKEEIIESDFGVIP